MYLDFFPLITPTEFRKPQCHSNARGKCLLRVQVTGCFVHDHLLTNTKHVMIKVTALFILQHAFRDRQAAEKYHGAACYLEAVTITCTEVTS